MSGQHYELAQFMASPQVSTPGTNSVVPLPILDFRHSEIEGDGVVYPRAQTIEVEANGDSPSTDNQAKPSGSVAQGLCRQQDPQTGARTILVQRKAKE